MAIDPIIVTVSTQGGDSSDIETPLDIAGGEFIAELCETLNLPSGNADGGIIRWRLDDRSTGRTIDLAKTLQENGVANGHTLDLLRQVTAGGGPEIPRTVRSQRVWHRALVYQLIYAICGLAAGSICVLGGIALFLRGVMGATSWSTKILGFDSQLTDAAPGALLFAAGVFIIWTTRLSTRVK